MTGNTETVIMQPYMLMFVIFFQLFGFTFFICLPYMCKDWAHSPLFSGDDKLISYVKTAMALNDKRYYKAQMYFAELDLERLNTMISDNEIKNHNEKHVYDFAVGIVTNNRETDKQHKYNLGYLTQALAAIHDDVRHSHSFASVKVFICNIDEDPLNYFEAMNLEEYVQFHTKYHKSTVDQFKSMDQFEKQKQDYLFCMQKSTNYTSKYTILIEDDVVIHKNFFRSLRQHLSTHLAMLEKGGHLSKNKKWAFMKLFYPNKWRGFGNTLSSIMELIGIFILSGVVSALTFTLMLSVLTKYKFISNRKHNNLYITYSCFAIGGFYGFLTCYLIGRVYVINSLYTFFHFSRLFSKAPGCCTQAILYPSYIIPELQDYMKTKKCHIDFSTDLLIDEFAAVNNYQTFVVEPNMAEHIGMVSSVRAWAKTAAEYIFPIEETQLF